MSPGCWGSRAGSARAVPSALLGWAGQHCPGALCLSGRLHTREMSAAAEMPFPKADSTAAPTGQPGRLSCLGASSGAGVCLSVPW